MARLILSLDSQVLAEYNMSKERYTIGRLPDNDVRIDNPAVSGHHSLIINILNDSFLEDLNSTNGTYVNGKLVKKHALQHGDVITIGHHQLRFSDQQVSEPVQDEFEKTMVIPPSKQNQEQLARAHEAAEAALANRDSAGPDGPATERLDMKKLGLSGSNQSPQAAGAPAVDAAGGRPVLPFGKLQVLNGSFAGRELELTKALTTLGRPGVQVAAITRRSDGYFIVHVDSGRAGDYPLVNGEPIGAQARRLKENDVLQLAGVKMGFFSS